MTEIRTFVKEIESAWRGPDPLPREWENEPEIQEYIVVTETDDERMKITVGYFDHKGYTHCDDGTGDGGEVEISLALRPTCGDWGMDLVERVITQMVQAIRTVREVTDTDPDDDDTDPAVSGDSLTEN